MKKLFLFLLLLPVFGIFAQGRYSLSGQVADSISGDFLPRTGLSITRLADSSKTVRISDAKGKFGFESLKNGKYRLSVSYVGYRTLQKVIEIKNRDLDLHKILLKKGRLLLQDMVILGKATPVVQKGDTSEYNAEAFKTNKDASAEDLVSKMPGISVQDGKYQAQGEDVKNVLVDGKPFFGDDPNAVLKSLPAGVIDRIQVFDQMSDQSQFTGFDDGNTSKTLNIITRTRVREGTFGKLSSAYGQDEKYKASGNLNFFNGDRRISVLTQINNVNEQNFSNEDLLGVMSSSGRRGQGGGRAGSGNARSQGSPGGPGGVNASNFLVANKNGLTTTKAFGLNYMDKLSDKIEVNASYFFNLTNNDAESVTNREYFSNLKEGQSYVENSSSNFKNTNHRFNMKLDYQIDSLNSITLRPKLSAQLNDGSGGTVGATYFGKERVNSIDNWAGSNLNALQASSEMLLRHKFQTKGRTISLDLNTSYKKNTGDNRLISESVYYGHQLLSDTLDQISSPDKNGSSLSANLVYTEPFTENSQLQFNAKTSYSEDESNQYSYDKVMRTGLYTDLDSTLSSVYRKIYRTENFGAGYRYRKGQFSLMAGLSYNIANLENNRSFPYAGQIERRFYSILPSFNLRYAISKDQNLRINYRASNDDPSLEQLQSTVDNSNPLQLTTGNPNLKQDYSHSFTLRYSKISLQHMNSFFLMLGGTYTQDYIGSSRILANKDSIVANVPLKQGAQLTMPVNLDGYFSLKSMVSYGVPIDMVESNINFSLFANYSRTPGMVNAVAAYSKSLIYGGGIALSSNISQDFDFNVSSNSTFTNLKNDLNTSADNNSFNQNSKLKFYWMFWEGFFLQSDLSHEYDRGLSGGYNRNTVQWNASFGKKLFAADRGEIRFSINDILNQNTNIERNITDTYFEDVRSNVLGRYYIVSFVYNLRQF